MSNIQDLISLLSARIYEPKAENPTGQLKLAREKAIPFLKEKQTNGEELTDKQMLALAARGCINLTKDTIETIWEDAKSESFCPAMTKLKKKGIEHVSGAVESKPKPKTLEERITEIEREAFEDFVESTIASIGSDTKKPWLHKEIRERIKNLEQELKQEQVIDDFMAWIESVIPRKVVPYTLSVIDTRKGIVGLFCEEKHMKVIKDKLSKLGFITGDVFEDTVSSPIFTGKLRRETTQVEDEDGTIIEDTKTIGRDYFLRLPEGQSRIESKDSK